MELLFKREQTTGSVGRVNFKLWVKLEVTQDEQALIRRYRFDESILIGADDRHLLRGAVRLGAIVFVIAALFLTYLSSSGITGLVGGLAAGAGAGYWHMNEKRETIFVKDLLHGRHFTCESVVELAKKEAWLEGACESPRMTRRTIHLPAPLDRLINQRPWPSACLPASRFLARI
tara:strand:+ start:301 stop:825 length:525 start_codon:yes stop_codon:yes gene_type:complete